MANNMKFELNRAGVGELLKGSAMQGVLSSYGDSIASGLGDGHSKNVAVLGTRAVCSVHADTYAARKKNLEQNTLLKALGSSGLSMSR